MNCLSLPKFKLSSWCPSTGNPNELAESTACYYHRQVLYPVAVDYSHFSCKQHEISNLRYKSVARCFRSFSGLGTHLFHLWIIQECSALLPPQMHIQSSVCRGEISNSSGFSNIVYSQDKNFEGIVTLASIVHFMFCTLPSLHWEKSTM